MNILVLGHNGMLGHMVLKYMTDQNHPVKTTNFKYPSDEFQNDIVNFKGNYIVNCIGAIPQKTKDFQINYELPIWLENNSPCPILHPGTDCEIDDDEYGVSKRKASDFIKLSGKKTKIIKASIIGPELNSNSSLMEWFLDSKNEVYGYSKAMWNGITTYEWAQQCLKIMLNWSEYNIENIVYSECISKFELLNEMKEIFDKNINIISIDKGINKCLIGNITASNIKTQLYELKNYYY